MHRQFIQLNASVIRLQNAAHDAQQCRLACSVGTQHAKDAAFLQLQRKIGNSLLLSKRLADLIYREQASPSL